MHARLVDGRRYMDAVIHQEVQRTPLTGTTLEQLAYIYGPGSRAVTQAADRVVRYGGRAYL